MKAVTHLEKVIAGEVSAETHLEKVIANETSAVTYTEKVIAGEAPPITHLEKVIAGEASPVTHLECVWAGSTPEPTEHEYTGIVPYTFTANGETLLDWYIKGNTVQSGTPSPSTPITPNGCGERTGNLFGETMTSAYHLDTTTGLPVTYGNNSRCATLTPIDVSNYDTVTFSFVNEVEHGKFFMYSTFNGSTLIERVASKRSGYSIDVSNATKLYIAVYSSSTSVDCAETITNIMLNSGSTALPYEPYGIKIPISSANTTTPVYLGEVQTTRQIEKINLDELSWTYISTASYSGFYIYDYTTDLIEAAGGYCNKLVVHTGTFTSAPNNSITIFESSGRQRLFIRYDDAQGDTTALMAMLSGAVFYGVKTTPTTGIVNEPLMRIGDYADSLTATQAGVEIPTNNGSTTIDVDTTVKPSEVYIKYKG